MSVKIHYDLTLKQGSDPLLTPNISDKEEHRKMMRLWDSCVENEIDPPPKFLKYLEKLCAQKQAITPEIYVSMLRHGVFDFLGEDLSSSGDGFSWDEEEKVMKALSANWPDIVFRLYLRYPEYEDEVHYYSCGKMQKAECEKAFAAFDPEKLK